MLYLAQMATPDAWGEFTKLGIAGVFLGLCITAIIRLYNDLGKERSARLEDSKASAQMVRDSTEAIVKSTVAQEERNRAMEKMSDALNALSQRMGAR